MSGRKNSEKKIIVQNRKAKHNYFIENSLEAGIILTGSEVKSVRQGNVNITDSYADKIDGNVYLLNLHIAEYKGANRFNHKPDRPRRLLMHKREIKKIFGKLKIKGYTFVPLSLYFNDKGIIKVTVGLAKGKKQYDKRAVEKERDWNRSKRRMDMQ